MHVPGLKLSGVRSYQGTSRLRLLLPKEEKDRSDTRLKDTSEPKKKDTSEPKKKDRSDRAPLWATSRLGQVEALGGAGGGGGEGAAVQARKLATVQPKQVKVGS